MIFNYENDKKGKLKFFQGLYEEARSYADSIYEDMEKNFKQYKGSAELDGSPVKADVVRNVTYELVESQVTGYIPTPTVAPKTWSDKNERNAKSVETLLKNKRNELPFEKLNDIDERFNPIYGGSVWLVEWDNGIMTHNTVGDIKVSCAPPKQFVGQPNIFEIEDMEYCFITFETTKEDIARKYNVDEADAEGAESDENADDKTATLYVCYYKDEKDRVCQFVWSGEVALVDIEDYYARKRRVCKICGRREELCECDKPELEEKSEEYEELDRDVLLSDGSVIPAMSNVIDNGQIVTEIKKRQLLNDDGSMAFDTTAGIAIPMMTDIAVPKLEPTRLPFYTPKCFPIVIRKNTSEEGSLFGQSDCEFIRPQQQAINKLESRIHKKLMNSGVYPLVPEDFVGELDNSLFERVFRVKQGTVNLFGRMDLQVDISRDIAQADRLYDHAKRILGISDSFQGQYDASAQSGRAKQLQIQQAAGRLDSKKRMKNAAYADIDKIIFQYYLAYADEPRPAAYKDAHGRMQNVMFNRYDFIERDSAGEYYYNDEYLFSADSVVDPEQSRELLWQENRMNYQQGAYGDPTANETRLIFWLNMERTHYPFAHDNVERIREEIARQKQMAMLEQQVNDLAAKSEDQKGYSDFLVNTISNMQKGGAV